MPARPPRPANSRRAIARARFAGFTHDQSRQYLNAIGEHADEYAGIPFPIQGRKMVVHPSYKFAKVVNRAAEKPEARPLYKVRNRWARPDGFEVIIADETRTGRVVGWKQPLTNPASMLMATIDAACSGAWDIEPETVALGKLRSLIKPHLFEAYQLSGIFIETSKRSGLTYIFRRLRPTLVLTPHRDRSEMQVLCALCLHPIGYYEQSWAGCMVPTDEVVAHLMLMRGDEADFWRQANQHPAWHPSSGL